MGLVPTFVSARSGKQQMDLVNAITVYKTLFITGGQTTARKKVFYLHHSNTEDSRIIACAPLFFQRWMLARHAAAKIQGSTMLVVINNCREARWLDE